MAPSQRRYASLLSVFLNSGTGGAWLAMAEPSAVRTESISGSSTCPPALECSENNSGTHPPDMRKSHFLLEICAEIAVLCTGTVMGK